MLQRLALEGFSVAHGVIPAQARVLGQSQPVIGQEHDLDLPPLPCHIGKEAADSRLVVIAARDIGIAHGNIAREIFQQPVEIFQDLPVVVAGQGLVAGGVDVLKIIEKRVCLRCRLLQALQRYKAAGLDQRRHLLRPQRRRGLGEERRLQKRSARRR